MTEEAARPPGDDDSDDDGPDPRDFWRWVHRALRPYAGWIFMGIGFLLILLGYLGVSREALPAKQLPYLVSGGMAGVLFSVLGAYFLGTEELRRDSGRLDRLERMVEELHRVLLSGATGQTGDGQPLDASRDGGRERRSLVVVPGTETFHDPGCAAVEGKRGLTRLTPSGVRQRGLRPCPLCEPSLADAS